MELRAGRAARSLGNGPGSGEELLDDLAAVDDLDRPAEGAHVFLGGIDLERVAEAGEEVGDRDRLVLDLGPVGARGAEDLAPFDPTAGQGDVEHAGEVVAACGRVDLGS